MSPGFGAERAELRSKDSEKRLKTMTIHRSEDGSHVVELAHDAPHKPERFDFAPSEKEKLSAHIEKNLGLKLPGKAAPAESAEPSVSKSDFE
jgi:hypothetical protein